MGIVRMIDVIIWFIKIYQLHFGLMAVNCSLKGSCVGYISFL